MFRAFESIRKASSGNSGPVEYDAENVSKALVSAHNYLHNTLLAGNFSQVGKQVDSTAAAMVCAELGSLTNGAT